MLKSKTKWIIFIASYVVLLALYLVHNSFPDVIIRNRVLENILYSTIVFLIFFPVYLFIVGAILRFEYPKEAFGLFTFLAIAVFAFIIFFVTRDPIDSTSRPVDYKFISIDSLTGNKKIIQTFENDETTEIYFDTAVVNDFGIFRKIIKYPEIHN